MQPSRLAQFKQTNDLRASERQQAQRHQDMVAATFDTRKTILEVAKSFVDYLDHHTGKTEVVNQLKEIGTPDALKVVSAIEDLHKTLKTHENTDLSEITKVMRAVLSEAKQIPKDHPTIEIPKTVEVSNQKDYSKDLTAMLTAIKGIKLVAEAPKVNVPAPIVNVEKTDLTPVETATRAVEKAIQSLVFPEPVFDTKPLEKLLKQTNKLLDEIAEIRPGGGGGGGGRVSPFETSEGMPAFVQLNNGALPVVGATVTERFASAGGFDYVGEAAVGSSESASVWTISRYDATSGKVALNVAWDDYLTETYL